MKEFLNDIGPLKDTNDRWGWTPESVRGFSVKSCVYLFAGDDRRVRVEVIKACNKLCRNDVVPSKETIFTWRLLLDRLATRDALHKRGILTSNRDLCCVFCFKEVETGAHLFITCGFTKMIWDKKILGWEPN